MLRCGPVSWGEVIQPQERKKWAIFCMLLVHLQLHPCILPSSGKVMVCVAMWHVS